MFPWKLGVWRGHREKTLTSHGPKDLFSRTFWLRDGEAGIIFLITAAIRWARVFVCHVMCKGIELNGEAGVRDGGSGWAELYLPNSYGKS